MIFKLGIQHRGLKLYKLLMRKILYCLHCALDEVGYSPTLASSRSQLAVLLFTVMAVIIHLHDGEYLNFVSLQEVDLILGSLFPGREARFPFFFLGLT